MIGSLVTERTATSMRNAAANAPDVVRDGGWMSGVAREFAPCARASSA
jgi:hypothetical protein